MSIFRVVGWIFASLSLFSLIENLNAIKIKFWLDQWNDAYLVFVETLRIYCFGWVDILWMGVSEFEAHLIVLATNFYGALARTANKKSDDSKVDSIARMYDDNKTRMYISKEKYKEYLNKYHEDYAKKSSILLVAFLLFILFLMFIIVLPWIFGSVLAVTSSIVGLGIIFRYPYSDVEFRGFIEEIFIVCLMTSLLIAFNYSIFNELLLTF